MSAPLLLLRRAGGPAVVRPDVVPENEDLTGGGRIRCPRCGWQPRRHDRWSCVCGHVWNTFETRGRCPGCGVAWEQTQCLRCAEWSPHEDWYEDPSSE